MHMPTQKCVCVTNISLRNGFYYTSMAVVRTRLKMMARNLQSHLHRRNENQFCCFLQLLGRKLKSFSLACLSIPVGKEKLRKVLKNAGLS